MKIWHLLNICQLKKKNNKPALWKRGSKSSDLVIYHIWIIFSKRKLFDGGMEATLSSSWSWGVVSSQKSGMLLHGVIVAVCANGLDIFQLR